MVLIEIELLAVRLLQSTSYPCQWRPQVMSHIIGDLLVGLDEILYAVEHGIEILRQPVPFISRAAKRYAPAQPGPDYFSAGRDDFFDPCNRTPGCGYACSRCKNEK